MVLFNRVEDPGTIYVNLQTRNQILTPGGICYPDLEITLVEALQTTCNSSQRLNLVGKRFY